MPGKCESPLSTSTIGLDELVASMGMKTYATGRPMTVSDHVGRCFNMALAPDVRRATSYLASNYTVKASRRHRRSGKQTEIVVTIGRPNYAERRFIKACVKAGEPFPVRKVQLKFWPEKKRSPK